MLSASVPDRLGDAVGVLDVLDVVRPAPDLFDQASVQDRDVEISECSRLTGRNRGCGETMVRIVEDKEDEYPLWSSSVTAVRNG